MADAHAAAASPDLRTPSSVARPARSWWHRPWVQLAAMAVVLCAALVVGSGVGSGSGSGAAQRAAALDAQVRCPSCEDISVAQSSSSAAIAVRHEISRMVAAGRSDQQIENALVGQYGPTILLRPPTSGLTVVVWVVPVVVGAGAVLALGELFVTRARALRALRSTERHR